MKPVQFIVVALLIFIVYQYATGNVKHIASILKTTQTPSNASNP